MVVSASFGCKRTSKVKVEGDFHRIGSDQIYTLHTMYT